MKRKISAAAIPPGQGGRGRPVPGLAPGGPCRNVELSGKRLSFQHHSRRPEYRNVVSGETPVRREGDEEPLRTDKPASIPRA